MLHDVRGGLRTKRKGRLLATCQMSEVPSNEKKSTRPGRSYGGKSKRGPNGVSIRLGKVRLGKTPAFPGMKEKLFSYEMLEGLDSCMYQKWGSIQRTKTSRTRIPQKRVEIELLEKETRRTRGRDDNNWSQRHKMFEKV